MSPEIEFHQLLLDNYETAKNDLGYNATEFRRMLDELGAVETARKLICAGNPSEGFLRLWNNGVNSRLDLSVEAAVYDHQNFHCLFEADVVKRAKVRLRGAGYFETK